MMEIDLQEKMATKDEDNLLTYLLHAEKYTPDAVESAIEELRNRSYEFQNGELDIAHEKLRLKKDSKLSESVSALPASGNEDLINWDVPTYYSEKAIMGFSVFVTVAFSGVLMTMNLYNKNRKAAFISLAYSVLCSIGIFWLLSFIPDANSGFTIFLNGMGGLGLTKLIWPKYIGKNIRYTARPIWAPLSVAVVILVITIATVVYSANL
jgi:hypothetical protein